MFCLYSRSRIIKFNIWLRLYYIINDNVLFLLKYSYIYKWKKIRNLLIFVYNINFIYRVRIKIKKIKDDKFLN